MRQLKITPSITNRESNSLDRYLVDIAKEPLITPEEEVELARRIKTGDRLALDKLCKANLRFVVSVAKQYQNQGLGLQDLINEGNVGMIKAAQRFDETRGFKFISYAVWWIRQSILQAIAEQARIVRIPLNQDGIIKKIKKVYHGLEQKLGRRPSAEEIAEVLGISVEKVKDSFSINTRQISTEATINEDEDVTFLDVYVNNDSITTDNGLIKESLSVEIQRSLASLTEKEREVIILFYGIGQPYSLTIDEIASKFHFTRERVRQIKEKAIRRLKHSHRNKLLKAYLGE